MINTRDLQNLKSYQPGLSIDAIAKAYSLSPELIVKLSSNENPYGCSPKVIDALKSKAYGVNIYPDALGESLVQKLKDKFPGIGNAEIVVGNGMDNILETIGRLIFEPADNAIIPIPTFSYYELVTCWMHATPIFVPTDSETYQLNIDCVLRAVTPQTKIIFLCSPNNPTGNVLTWDEIQVILEYAQKLNICVFVDEAYVEYCSEVYSIIDRVQFYPNLIVGRTFSKLYGLAALRVGWAVMHESLLSEYRKVQTPFSVGSLGLYAAEVGLSDENFMADSIRNNDLGRKFLVQELNRLGYTSYPSQANFIAFEGGGSAAQTCESLLQKGIIVRNVQKSFQGVNKELIRCTVGTPEQNQKFIEALPKREL